MNVKNKVQLIGNLGQDPEIKTFDGDKKLAKFSIATNEIYTNNKGEKVKETQWHNIIAWGKTAGVAEKILRKGVEVLIEGKLITRSYTDKAGIKKYITEIEASEIVLFTKEPAAEVV